MSFRETFFKTNSLKFETYLIKISHVRSNTHSFYYYKLNGSRGTAFNIACQHEYIKKRNKYEDTIVTRLEIVKEELETYILVESATGRGMLYESEWVR